MDLHPLKRHDLEKPPRMDAVAGLVSLSCLCSLHAFMMPCTYKELVPLAKPREGSRQQTSRSAASPGQGSTQWALPQPAPASDPEQERPADGQPCTHLATGLHPACSFCQNACPRGLTCTPLCNLGLNMGFWGGFRGPVAHSPPATRGVWHDLTFHTDLSVCSCWMSLLLGVEGPRARPPAAVITKGGVGQMMTAPNNFQSS